MSEINHDNNVAMQYRKVWKKFHGLKKKIYKDIEKCKRSQSMFTERESEGKCN